MYVDSAESPFLHPVFEAAPFYVRFHSSQAGELPRVNRTWTAPRNRWSG